MNHLKSNRHRNAAVFSPVAWLGVGCVMIAVVGGELRAAPSAPADEDVRKLVTASLLEWNTAIQKKDFTAFHAQCATLFRDKLSPADLLKAFDDFIVKEADIAGVGKVNPSFDGKPAVDDDGVLVVKGQYPTSPLVVLFVLKYLNEGDQWKVVSIHVELKRIAPPPEAEVKKLVAATMADFAAAVQTKDFKPLIDKAAPVFQKEMTAEILSDAFKEFISRGVDLSAVKDKEPVLDADPTISVGPLLTVVGHYPLTQFQAVFKLKYMREQDQWKLVGIDVTTK